MRRFLIVTQYFEIDTLPFIEKVLSEGRRAAVPLCIGKGVMEARLIGSLSDLKPGAYGILEPGPESRRLAPAQIDLAVIPCAACSHDGKRLGFGGGYYDRYFSLNHVKNPVLVCRERLVRDDIPMEPHDIVFPLVITECGIFTRKELLPGG